MTQFTEEIVIEAGPTKVWEALAAIGDIYKWNPGVQASHTTSESTSGLGATRFCDLGGKNFLDEEVVQWVPNEKLTMRITDTNMPFDHADIHFALSRHADGTRVTVSPEYKLKWGLVGSVMDRVFVERTYQKGMASLLSGLKSYVEGEVS